MRLAQKFTAALVVVITLALAARGIFDTQRAIERNRARVHGAQHQLGEVLDIAVAEIWRAEGWEPALEFLRRVEAQQGDVQIRWVWLDEDSQEEYAPLVPTERILPYVGTSSTIAFDRTEIPGYLVTYRTVRIEALPLGAIELARSTAVIDAYIEEEMRGQVLIGLLVLFVYALVASILGRRWIGQPIEALVRQAKRVAEGDFTTVSGIRQRDEIGRLGREMNVMSNRLRSASERASAERAARLAIQQQLTHADRLASVGRITAAVIHDIGTPLNVISGRASMIADGDVSGEQIPDAARRISEQANRIAHMVRELLTFARRAGLEREPTVIADLAREVASLVQPLAMKARVKVVVEEARERLEAPVNRTQIRQVLMNLVMNAVQAMPNGGTIRIRIDEVEGHVRAAVADEGLGIEDAILERIFEPFFTTKGEGEGTGLGLSVCRTIVEHHGGRISVASHVGAGTTFEIRLPM